MGCAKQIVLIIAFFICGSIYAHKDRIAIPERFVFVLSNKQIVNLKFNDSNLEKISKDIVDKKVQISEVQIYYKTGEIVTIKSDGKNWTMFKVVFKKKSLYVPQSKLVKIPEIHFSTLNLLWSGESNAFDSHYLYFVFDIGTERSFDVFPSLELHFENLKFTRSEVWRQMSENSRQGKAL